MRNITSNQEKLLSELRSLDPELMMEWDEVRGVASFIRGKLTRPQEGKVARRPESKADPETAIQTFLAKYGELLGPPDFNKMLRLLRKRTDDLGWTHLEFQQMYLIGKSLKEQEGPLEVYGSKLAAHFMPDSTLIEVQSSCWREIKLEAEARLTVKELRETLMKAVATAPGFHELQLRMQEHKETDFPLMQKPRLVVYPWQGGFRLAWTTYAYGVIDVEDPSGKPTGAKRIDLGQVFIDASTGEQFLFAPTRKYVETPDTGSGLGVTPLGGPYVSRNLNIVRVDNTSTYRLRDTTHARDIIVYDVAGNSNWSEGFEVATALNAGTLPVSEDTDGDRNWNRLPANTTDTERTASQQPEVDAYFFCREAYEWYNALAGAGGRAGWDNGQYPDPPVPHQPVRALAHVWDDYPVTGTPTSRSNNAFMDEAIAGGKWYAFLAYFDGDPTATCSTPNDRASDYVAGSKAVVGHEYQHAITDFSFIDSGNNPGLTYFGWLAAVHEGLSDVFGCLFAENWFPGQDTSSAGLANRNLAFPRDPNTWCNLPYTANTPCGLSNHNKDHFADRNADGGFRYDRGTILAHCAYLMGQGGVHQRASRTPALIPVYSIGREIFTGKDMLKAARIWYRALTHYLSNIGTTSGIPNNDENTFRTIRNGCVSAATDIYGLNSVEHRTTVLAFYAVGLHPTAESYGADVTFLRWAASWWMSRPYIGISSPDWSSVDLFINNGGISEWNALINVIGSDGNPTQFENTVYCRVRNVGDQPAQNVQVQFFYAKAGTGVTTWLPVTDKNGNIQTLNVGTLGIGQSNFPDSAQNSPPATASVKWYIPPLAPGETVNHFCLKAVASCPNDVNPYNNDVQSNIAYVQYTPGESSVAFMVGNPTEEEIPLELVVQATLPKGWRARIRESTVGMRLEPGEERPFHIAVDMLPGADKQLEPPLDGELKGQVFGSLSGPFAGVLTETIWDGQRLQGRLGANIADIGVLVGKFVGTLNILTGQVKGRVTGIFQCADRENAKRACVGVEACLRPLRRINISQLVKGKPVGGITIHVQVPMLAGPCAEPLPPTDTHVVPGRIPMPMTGKVTV